MTRGVSGKTRGWKWAAVAIAVIVALGGAFWAGRVTMRPIDVVGDLPSSEVLADVAEQSVGRTLNLNVTVAQPKRALAVNALVGVVTEIRPTDEVAQGEVLYRVAGVPVRAIAGGLPFYRSLGQGDRGVDVRQLEEALVGLRLLSRADDRFDSATASALEAWQGRLGIPKTGVVPLGEIVAIPALPAALLLDPEAITLGGVLAGGERIVFGASGEPVFQLRLAQQQARMVPESAIITMSYQGRDWVAVIASTEQRDTGETVYTLSAPDGGPVCGHDCAVVATGAELSILSEVAVVPPVTGPAVPVTAVTTNPDGSAFVIVVDGSGSRARRPVTVIGSQDGVAVLEGVQVGERVQVFAASGAGQGGGIVPGGEATPGR